MIIFIDESDAEQRIDAFLSQSDDLELSRKYIQDLIKEEKILVNKKKTKASYKLRFGDSISVDIPAPKELAIKPEEIVIDIVFEDDQLIVINKPIDMVTHPAPGAESGTLVNALMHHVSAKEIKVESLEASGTGEEDENKNKENSPLGLSGINGVLRPGIVHRLDKDTSGLIVVAKTDIAHRSLAKQIEDRSLERRYLALVHDNIKDDQGAVIQAIARHPKERKKMTVDSNGRFAKTNWFIKERFDRGNNKQFCLVECKLDTGRTHQIRVHMQWLKHPIVGDKVYGRSVANLGFKASRPMLHSYKMSLTHPVSGEKMDFEAEAPEDFLLAIRSLRK